MHLLHVAFFLSARVCLKWVVMRERACVCLCRWFSSCPLILSKTWTDGGVSQYQGCKCEGYQMCENHVGFAVLTVVPIGWQYHETRTPRMSTNNHYSHRST